jgi:hypothetical protein
MTAVAASRDDDSAEPAIVAKSPIVSVPHAPAKVKISGVDDEPNRGEARQPDATGFAESTEFEAAAALPQVLKIIGTVVAPTTLLTALLFYFGLMFAVGYFRYFNVNFTVLNLPVQDYLILSVDGLIIPLVYAVGITLLALWLYQLRLETLSSEVRRIVLRAVMLFAAIAGAVLVSLAMANAVFGISVFPATFWEARGLSLSIGVLLLAYAGRLRRILAVERRPRQVLRRVPEGVLVAKWGALFIVVSVGLFWVVGSYAIGVGEGRAQELAAYLPCSPDVVLYSQKSLNLQGAGLREVIGQNPDIAYRFRYDGLKLVPQSGNQYLFLPADWTHVDGDAILIPRSETIRLEFGPPSQIRNAGC